MSLNVNEKEKDDPNYRYKMPKPELEYQGKNQNTYTIIKNMKKYADLFGHPSYCILKNIAGKGSRFDIKNNSIKGTLSYNDVLNRLYDYINHYILCPKCLKPELELKVIKNYLSCECHACSATTKLNHDNKYKKKIKNDFNYCNKI